jgi:hypothetical protein
MSGSYINAEDRWYRPIMKGFWLECCDCCLTHRLQFRIRSGRVEMKISRNNRATMNKRRHAPIVARKTVALQLKAMKRLRKKS